MPIFVFLLTLGLAALTAGFWVAFDVRGAARSLERYSARNAELRAQAQGRLGPPDRVASAVFFRILAGVVGAAGSVLTLLSTALLAGA
ncbi:hypothetical protein [Streptomyces venezuelae]|nr:hypothetical protein [Streptomyces venezuelae]